MNRSAPLRLLLPVLLSFAPTAGLAQLSDQPAAAAHRHQTLTVHSRPVIERLPLQVISPADIVSTASGRVFVADQAGQTVMRIAADGQVALIADELEGLTRICVSESEDVFALLSSSGSGRIMHLTPSGHVSEIARTPFPPAGLARDQIGNLLTTNRSTGQVIRIDDQGQLEILTRLSEPAQDLILDSIEAPVILLRSGKVVSVGFGGNSRVIGYVPESARRLRLHPDGNVVALGQPADADRGSLWQLTSTPDEISGFAMLPAGTSAFAFDALGNLVLANPDLRAITRVTSRFRIPCPHCSEPVLMVFSTEPAAETESPSRSF